MSHGLLAQRVAKIISLVLHPFVVPVLTFAYLSFGFGEQPVSQALLPFLVASLCASVLIALIVGGMYRTKLVNSVDLDDRRDRPIPLLASSCCYLLGFFLTRWLGAHEFVSALLFCYASNTLIIALISYYWKISIHTTATAGPLVAIAFAIGSRSWPLFVLLPTVAASRLVLRKHSFLQVTAGAAAGLFFTWIQLEFLFRF